MSYKALGHDSRSLYEILGTKSGATAGEIKKAYRKRALRLHPDKQKLNPTPGADEEFLKVNAAYNILSNENARRAYDSFGLQAAITTVDPTQADPSAMFANLSPASVFCIILLIILVCGFAATTPILVSLRWDETASFSWVAAFIPILICQVALIGIIVVVTCPHLMDPGPDDEGRPSLLTVVGRLASLISTISSLILFALLEVLVGLKLDGSVTYTWLSALAPWIVLECIGTIDALLSSGSDYKEKIQQAQNPMEPEEEEELKNRTLITDGNFIVFLLGVVVSRACRLAFAGLVAGKLDGDLAITWWTAFAPIWFLLAYKSFCGCLGCVGLFFGMEPRPPAGISPEDRARMQYTARCAGPVFLVLCTIAPLAGMVTLLVSKLEYDNFPAAVVFIPFFIAVGICCCVMTFATCALLLRKTDEPQTGETYGTGTGPGGSDAPYTRAEEGENVMPGNADATRTAEKTPVSAHPSPPPAAAAGEDEDISDID